MPLSVWEANNGEGYFRSAIVFMLEIDFEARLIIDLKKSIENEM